MPIKNGKKTTYASIKINNEHNFTISSNPTLGKKITTTVEMACYVYFCLSALMNLKNCISWLIGKISTYKCKHNSNAITLSWKRN